MRQAGREDEGKESERWAAEREHEGADDTARPCVVQGVPMGDIPESSPRGIRKRSMTGPRIALALALGLAIASASQAKVSCPDRVEFRTCIGVAAAATVEF